MKYYTLLLTQLCLFLSFSTFAQSNCEKPISMNNPTVTHAACVGKGRIKINKISPSNSTYQKALYDTLGNTVRPWQDSDTFKNISAGVYDIIVRKVCQPGFSDTLKRRVTINDQSKPLDIKEIRTLREDQCGNGQIQVLSVTGKSPFKYALVNSINATDIESNMIRSKQDAAVFSNLQEGTYYVRVYDECGNYKTQEYFLAKYTDTVQVVKNGNAFLTRTNCDTFQYSIRINNQNLFYKDAATQAVAPYNNKFWIEFPNGHIDTIENVYEVVSNAIPMSYLADSINPNEPFPYNMAWPVILKAGYIDECGNTFTNNNLDIQNMLGNGIRMFINDNVRKHPDCDSVYFWFSFGNGNAHNQKMGPHVLVSLDSINWHPYGEFDIPGLPSGIYSAKADSTYTLYLNYCGRILTRTFDTPSETRKISSQYNYNKNTTACFGNSGWHLTLQPTGNGNAYQYKYYKIENNDTIDITDEAHIVYNNPDLSISPNAKQVYELINVEPGEYIAHFFDTLNTDCPTERTYYKNLIEDSLQTPNFDIDYSCEGALLLRTENLVLRNAIGGYGSWSGLLKMQIIGHESLGTFSGLEQVDKSTIITVPHYIMNDLDPGNYQVKIWNEAAEDSTCNSSIVLNIEHTTERLNIENSKFIRACNNKGAIIVDVNGGEGPYNYQLYKNSISSANLMGSSQHENIFEDLDLNEEYIISVSDNCGNASTLAISNSELTLPLFHNYTEMPCEGSSLDLGVYNLLNLTYEWTKNGQILPGENGPTLNIDPITLSDSGLYQVKIILDNCAIHSNTFHLTPSAEDCGEPLSDMGIIWSVKNIATNNHIKWQEVNNKIDQYSIEYSRNGLIWNTLTKVNSTRKEKTEHTFTHSNLSDGKHFYRIVMYKEGESFYSNIKQVLIGKNENLQYKVSPNPTRDNIRIVGLAYDNTVVITNNIGKEVLNLKNPNYEQDIILDKLPKGLYFIHIYDKETLLHTEKLLIQ
ncbi:MAG TPA: T9SS type A sorting domain-containing protein [Chitinophagaceae bacterium]|nr:T9SS type A sorting domain-containing protein [Chitinophagaceae bacterium]